MISVIIPALNESRALPQTLTHLFRQAGDFEAILVDGGSTDDTLAKARAWPQLRVLSSEPGRASQMNAGAAAASGQILMFLHADTRLPDDAIASLNQFENDKNVQWGGFHQRFSGDSWALRMISRIHNMRCRLTNIFYGDQVIFVRRNLFESLHGFPVESELEDIVFSESLLKHAAPAFLADTVTTDSRKFEQMGPLRSLARCLLILLCYELRLPLAGRRFFEPIR